MSNFRVMSRWDGEIFAEGFSSLENAENYISALPAKTRWDCYAEACPDPLDKGAIFTSLGLTAEGKLRPGTRAIWDGGRDEKEIFHLECAHVDERGRVFASVIDYEGYGQKRQILGVFDEKPEPDPVERVPETVTFDDFGNPIYGDGAENI
jgi:hypothetical protein